MSTAEGELVQSKRAQLTRARGYNVVAWCSGAGPSRGLRPQLHVATRAWLEVFEDEEVRAVAGDDMRVTALRCVGADRGSNEGTIVDERGGPEGRSNCQNPACNAAPPWCPGHSMYFDLPRAIMQPIGGELARFIVEAFAVKRDDGGGLFLALPACADAWAGSLEAARAANKPRDFRVELADPPTRAAADKRLKRLQEWGPPRLAEELARFDDDVFARLGFPAKAGSSKAWVMAALFMRRLYVMPYALRLPSTVAPQAANDFTSKLRGVLACLPAGPPASRSRKRRAPGAAAAASAPVVPPTPTEEAVANLVDKLNLMVKDNRRGGQASADGAQHGESALAASDGKNRQPDKAQQKRLDSSGRGVVAAASDVPFVSVSMSVAMANRLIVLAHVTAANRERLQAELYAMFESRRGSVPEPHFSREVPGVVTAGSNLARSPRLHAEIAELRPGETVKRSLIPGDKFFFNRQPTLCPHGIAVFALAYVTDSDVIGMHPIACPPYNADFDGDEMNTLTPLDQADALEAWLLSNTVFAKHAGAPLHCWSQDGMVGLHLASGAHFSVSATDARALLAVTSDRCARAAAALPKSGRVGGRALLWAVFSALLGEDFAYREGGAVVVGAGSVHAQLEARHLGRSVDGLYAAAARSRGVAAARLALWDTDRLGCALSAHAGISLRLEDYDLRVSAAAATAELRESLALVATAAPGEVPRSARVTSAAAAARQLLAVPFFAQGAPRDAFTARAATALAAWVRGGMRVEDIDAALAAVWGGAPPPDVTAKIDLDAALGWLACLGPGTIEGRAVRDDDVTRFATNLRAGADALLAGLPPDHWLAVYLKRCSTKNRGTLAGTNGPLGAARQELPAFSDRATVNFSRESREPEAFKVAMLSHKRGAASSTFTSHASDARQGYWRTAQATSGPGAENKDMGARYAETYVNESLGVSDRRGRTVCALYGDGGVCDRRVLVWVDAAAAAASGASAADVQALRAHAVKTRGGGGAFAVTSCVDYEDIVACARAAAAGARADADWVARCVAAAEESFGLSCAAPAPLRAALETDRALLRVMLAPLAGQTTRDAAMHAARRAAEEYRMTRISPGEPAGQVAVYCIFQNLTQKMLDSKHDNKGAAGMREVRCAFSGRAGRARLQFDVRGTDHEETLERATRAVAWITAAPLTRVAAVRVARAGVGGDAVSAALAAEAAGAVAVDLALRPGTGWSPALLLRALSTVLAGARAPGRVLALAHASAWGPRGDRRARLILLYASEDAARGAEAALLKESVGFARDVELSLAPDASVARVSCAAPGAQPGDRRTGAVAPLLAAAFHDMPAGAELGIDPASIVTSDPLDALRHWGELAFREVVARNLSAVFDHSIAAVHFGLVADFMAVHGPWVHPTNKECDRLPLTGHGAILDDGGPLANLFYKYVRRGIKFAYTRPVEEAAIDVRESPLMSTVLGGAPVRRGTNMVRVIRD